MVDYDVFGCVVITHGIIRLLFRRHLSIPVVTSSNPCDDDTAPRPGFHDRDLPTDNHYYARTTSPLFTSVTVSCDLNTCIVKYCRHWVFNVLGGLDVKGSERKQ